MGLLHRLGLAAAALGLWPIQAVPARLSAQAPASALAAKAQSDGRVAVIVGHQAPVVPEGRLPNQAAVDAQRAAIGLTTQAVLNSLPAGAARDARYFETIPYFAVEVDSAGLAALTASPLVTSIEEDVAVPPVLAQSAPLVQANGAWSAGYTGAGWTVAILDTGVESSHSGLSGKVVSEACYSTSSGSSTSLCPGGVGSSTATGSGAPCAGVPSCDHGTHVAGIAAGNVTGLPGIARGATIIAIQVFSRFTSGCSGGAAACLLSRTSDRLLAHERVLALSTQFNIASVNMSIGGQASTTPCGASSEKAAIDNLRAAGIATVVASGNDGAVNAITYPACISSAVSVGSTTKSDAVSSFSNTASFLSLLAPGSSILSAVTNNGTGTKSGTSMAAPHVAGAWAILKQFRPAATVTEALAVLRATGQPVLDGGNGLTFPRVRIKAALDSAPLAFGKTSPSTGSTGQGGSVAISWGASSWLDGYEYCVDTSNNNQCDASWTPTGTAPSATLAGLTPGRTYYWQARASNSAGTTAADSNAWWSFATAPVTNPAMAVDTPYQNTTVGTWFTISGWAVDRAATSGTGVDLLHVWAFPQGSGAGQFVGQPTYGAERGDIGDLFGSQFTNSGFSLDASLAPGTYLLVVYSHSSVTGSFEQVIAHTITVQPPTQPYTYIDQPAFISPRSASAPFEISGWALDRGSTSGTGVNLVHIWAFKDGQQPGTFICENGYGRSRPDVANVFGHSRFTNSGYSCTVDPATFPGAPFAAGTTWFFVVFGNSAVTGSFSQSAGAWVTFSP